MIALGSVIIHANKTIYPSNFDETDRDVSKEKTLDLLSQKIILNKNNLITKETLKLIRKIYAKDYKNFHSHPIGMN